MSVLKVLPMGLNRSAVSDADSENNDDDPSILFPIPLSLTMVRTPKSPSSSSSSSEEEDAEYPIFVPDSWNPLERASGDIEEPPAGGNGCLESSSTAKDLSHERASSSTVPASPDSWIIPIIFCVFFCCTIPVMIPILIIFYSRATKAG